MHNTLILAIIQGITEFLPVSSSAHLIAAAQFFQIHGSGRLLEVVLHIGTLLAVLLYFHTTVWHMVQGLFGLLKLKILSGAEEFFKICWASLPVVGAGYFVHHLLPEGIHTLNLIAWVSMVMGLLLILVDLKAPAYKLYDQLTYKDAFIIGCIQTLALIPGASRLGSTLIGARLCGYQRTEAAKLSFLLSIPAVVGANTLVCLKLWESGSLQFNSHMYGALLLTFLIGMAAIRFFLYWLQTHTLWIFGIYRILFGIGLLLLG